MAISSHVYRGSNGHTSTPTSPRIVLKPDLGSVLSSPAALAADAAAFVQVDTPVALKGSRGAV